MNALQQSVFTRGIDAVTSFQAIALAAPFVIAVSERGIGTLQIAITAVITGLVWEAIFSLLRSHRWSFNSVTTGLIIAICVVPDLPLVQTVVAVSLGVVLGELIFGGRGFNFLNAAVVGMAILLLSFPTSALAPLSTNIAISTLPGAVLLLLAGLLPWRVAATFMLTDAAIAFFLAGMDAAEPLLIASAFGGIFLVADPFACAQTKVGHIVHGFLAAMLVLLFNGGIEELSPRSIIQAALLGSLFGPLIDQTIIAINAKLRGRQYG